MMLARVLVAVALISAATTMASARKAVPERAALQRYCSGDLVTFCDGMPPDGQEVKACFKQHMSELSPGCQEAISRYERAQKQR